MCRSRHFLKGWFTFGEYLTATGVDDDDVDVRKLEWLSFCVVSKYLQSII